MAGEKKKYRWVEAIALFAVSLLALGIMLVTGPFRASQPPEDGEGGRSTNLRHLEVAVAPIYGDDVLPAELMPIADSIEAVLDLDLSLSRSKTTSAAIDALTKGDADLAVLPALACVQAEARDSEVTLLVVQSFSGAFSADTLLVARRGWSETKLSQLRGKSLCFSDTSSTSYLLARLWFRSNGYDGETYFSAHRACGSQLKALSKLVKGNQCDVVAMSEPALEVSPSRGVETGDVEIVARTGHVPLECWAAGPDIEEHLRFNLRKALSSFEVRTSTEGESVGQTLRITGFRDVRSSTYRSIKIAARLENWLLPPGSTHD